jgi:hypothetical protein
LTKLSDWQSFEKIELHFEEALSTLNFEKVSKGGLANLQPFNMSVTT